MWDHLEQGPAQREGELWPTCVLTQTLLLTCHVIDPRAWDAHGNSERSVSSRGWGMQRETQAGEACECKNLEGSQRQKLQGVCKAVLTIVFLNGESS